jgi:hypothetical protein
MARPSDLKPYAKRSLIFTDKAKARARTHNRDKSIVYQNWHVQKLGHMFSYAMLELAMSRTRKAWEKEFKQYISPARAVLIPMVQLHCSYSKSNTFTVHSFKDFIYPLGFDPRGEGVSRPSLSSFIGELVRLHLCNPLSYGVYTPTNRMRLFCQRFDKEYKAIIEGKEYIPTTTPDKK